MTARTIEIAMMIGVDGDPEAVTFTMTVPDGWRNDAAAHAAIYAAVRSASLDIEEIRDYDTGYVIGAGGTFPDDGAVSE